MIPGVSTAKGSAKYHPRAVPHLTLAKVKCPEVTPSVISHFSRSPGSERFPRRSASEPTNCIESRADRSGTGNLAVAQLVSQEHNLWRDEPTNRAKDKKRKGKNPARRGKEGTNARSLSSYLDAVRRGIGEREAGNELAIIVADIFPRYPCRAAQS